MPEPMLRIRPATRADLPAVLELCAQLNENGEVLPIETATRIFARFADYPDYTLYVAERSGTVVGTFALLVMHNLGHLGTPSGIVENVAVDPAAHGQGIGQDMMAFALDRCRDKGCYKLVLSSSAKRERAHAFYESLGFVRHGYSFHMELAPEPVAT